MRGLIAVVIFIAVTALSWGSYGSALKVGTEMMTANKRELSFMCLGLAYFVVAVVIPMIRLKTKGEQGNWTFGGTVTSIISGVLGALGALGIIMAFAAGGNPIYVMPLVFGGAPVVNTIVSMVFAKAYKDIRPMFLVGLVLVATGAILVLVYKPHVGPAHAGPATPPNTWLIVGSIIMTALCWGSYGPVLHKGQMAMNGSRLRPFVCVGLAYFLVAVLGTAAWMLSRGVSIADGWTASGATWALIGGAVGAIGALGIIFAFNFGGKPVFVMPLVFGGAPVVSTFTEIIKGVAAGAELHPELMFFVALATVILGAALTLVFAPRGHKPGPAKVAELKPAAATN